MGKGDKRRFKKPPLPKLAKTTPVTHRGSRPAANRMPEEAANATAMRARCRKLNIAATEAHMDAVSRLPGEGDIAIALALYTDDHDQRRRMAETYAAWDAAETIYAARILSANRHAKTAKIEHAPERFEATANDPVDLRNADEKDRAAVATYMRWRGWIGCLPSYMQVHLFNGALGRYPLHDHAGKLKGPGRDFCAALARLVDIADA